MAVFERTMRLLDVFSELNTETVSLTTLSKRTGLPLTTAHRLCAQLIDEGILERSSDGHYAIGLRLWELSQLPSRARTLRGLAFIHLQDLYAVTHEIAQVSLLDDTELVIVERMTGKASIHSPGHSRGRLPVHATADGVVILANEPPEKAERLVRGGLVRYTADTVRDEAGLKRLMATARAQGWVELNGHFIHGQISIAAPIRGKEGVVAAVSLIFDKPERVNSYLPAVAVTARRISADLVANERTLSNRDVGANGLSGDE